MDHRSLVETSYYLQTARSRSLQPQCGNWSQQEKDQNVRLAQFHQHAAEPALWTQTFRFRRGLLGGDPDRRRRNPALATEPIDPPLTDADHILVVCGPAHVATIARQLPELAAANIIVEPSPHGTGPALIARHDPRATTMSLARQPSRRPFAPRSRSTGVVSW